MIGETSEFQRIKTHYDWYLDGIFHRPTNFQCDLKQPGWENWLNYADFPNAATIEVREVNIVTGERVVETLHFLGDLLNDEYFFTSTDEGYTVSGRLVK